MASFSRTAGPPRNTRGQLVDSKLAVEGGPPSSCSARSGVDGTVTEAGAAADARGASGGGRSWSCRWCWRGILAVACARRSQVAGLRVLKRGFERLREELQMVAVPCGAWLACSSKCRYISIFSPGAVFHKYIYIYIYALADLMCNANASIPPIFARQLFNAAQILPRKFFVS